MDNAMMFCGSARQSAAEQVFASCVPVHSYRRVDEPNITISIGNRRTYRYDRLPAPPPGAEGARPHITTVTESGECRVHRSLHVKTAQPVRLDALRLFAGEHGVMAVSVVGEDRVVVPLAHVTRVGEASMATDR